MADFSEVNPRPAPQIATHHNELRDTRPRRPRNRVLQLRDERRMIRRMVEPPGDEPRTAGREAHRDCESVRLRDRPLVRVQQIDRPHPVSIAPRAGGASVRLRPPRRPAPGGVRAGPFHGSTARDAVNIPREGVAASWARAVTILLWDLRGTLLTGGRGPTALGATDASQSLREPDEGSFFSSFFRVSHSVAYGDRGFGAEHPRTPVLAVRGSRSRHPSN